MTDNRNQVSFETLDEIVAYLSTAKFPFMVFVRKDYTVGDITRDLARIAMLREAGVTPDRVERLAEALCKADHAPYKVDWQTYPPWVKDRWRRVAEAGLDAFGQELAMAESARRLVFEAGGSDVVVEISNEDLIRRLRKHVLSRGTPVLKNGIWALMLEAGRRLAQAYRVPLNARKPLDPHNPSYRDPDFDEHRP